jgi:hypothetical protein
MTKIGQPIPLVVQEIRSVIMPILTEYSMRLIDADSITSGKDFLFKIWQLIISVPVGIAIIYEGISQQTIANIFYELGFMQAYGKEIIVIKAGDIAIPSDFIRTEYITYDDAFIRHFRDFMNSLDEQADHYVLLADELENNPLISIDYLKRAYLLTGNKEYQDRARLIHKSCDFKGRAKNSVESLMIRF